MLGERDLLAWGAVKEGRIQKGGLRMREKREGPKFAKKTRTKIDLSKTRERSSCKKKPRDLEKEDQGKAKKRKLIGKQKPETLLRTP